MKAPPNRKAVVITAIPVEFKAVCSHLNEQREEEDEHGEVYIRGTFQAEDGKWDVLVAETGATNQEASRKTDRALRHFHPSVALFVGVAGGLKEEVKIGDVVAATEAQGYEYGKVSESFKPRPNVSQSTSALVNRAKAVAKAEEWRTRAGDRPIRDSQRAHVGPIASGEKVVANTDSDLHQFLQKHHSEALAVEMEGLGFLKAVHDYNSVAALVVRGISDLIDGKAESDKSGSQERAAKNASAFAFEVLSKFSSSKAASSGPFPAAEVTSPAAPVKKERPAKKSSGAASILRSVAIVLALMALGYVALQILGSSPRPQRGGWTREPHSGGRSDWHRGPSSR